MRLHKVLLSCLLALALAVACLIALPMNALADGEEDRQVHYGQKQLALDSDLCMDFYVAVNEAVATDENAKMQISLGGKSIGEVYLKDAKQVEMDDEWYCWYVFTAEVPVKDITKTISLQLTDSTGNVGDAYTYTVKQYADYLLANSTDEKVKNICQALLDYGAAAEKHFTNRAGGTVLDENLANGGDFGDRLTGVTIPAAYAPTKTGEIAGVSCYGTSLILEADTAIRLYFMADAQSWSSIQVSTNVVGAEIAVSELTRGTAYVEIKGIHAVDLDTAYTVTVAGGQEEIVITYSGLSYAWMVMNSNPAATLADMVKALYNYWAAAEAYSYQPDVPPEAGDDEFEILPVFPSEDPTDPPAEDPGANVTYEDYLAMSDIEKNQFQNSFSSVDAYVAWLRQAREEYDNAKDKTEVGDDGIVDLG